MITYGQIECPLCHQKMAPTELDILENPTAVVVTYRCQCGQEWSDTYEYKEREELT